MSSSRLEGMNGRVGNEQRVGVDLVDLLRTSRTRYIYFSLFEEQKGGVYRVPDPRFKIHALRTI